MSDALSAEIEAVVSQLDGLANELAARGDIRLSGAVLGGRQAIRVLATLLVNQAKEKESPHE